MSQLREETPPPRRRSQAKPEVQQVSLTETPVTAPREQVAQDLCHGNDSKEELTTGVERVLFSPSPCSRSKENRHSDAATDAAPALQPQAGWLQERISDEVASELAKRLGFMFTDLKEIRLKTMANEERLAESQRQDVKLRSLRVEVAKLQAELEHERQTTKPSADSEKHIVIQRVHRFPLSKLRRFGKLLAIPVGFAIAIAIAKQVQPMKAGDSAQAELAKVAGELSATKRQVAASNKALQDMTEALNESKEENSSLQRHHDDKAKAIQDLRSEFLHLLKRLKVASK